MSISNDWPSTGPDDPLHRRKHQPALRRARELCLSLPATAEKIARGHQPVITSGGKNFAIFRRADSRPNVCFSTPPGMQETLMKQDPERYFVPAYMGVRGWTGVRLDNDVDWDMLEQVARESHAWAVPARKLAKSPSRPRRAK